MRPAFELEVNDVLTTLNEVAPRAAPDRPIRHRRLSDKVLIAFHHACDTSDFEVAKRLLDLLEIMLARRLIHADHNRRRSIEGLVAAHERFWHLRHPVDDH